MSARDRRPGVRWWETERRYVRRIVPLYGEPLVREALSDVGHWNMLRRILLEIEHGTVTVVCREDAPPAETYAGNVEYETSNGWTIVVFNDCGEWDYIDHAIAPDGWRGEYEALPRDLQGYRCTEDDGWTHWGIPGAWLDETAHTWAGWQPRPGWQARRAMHEAELERYNRKQRESLAVRAAGLPSVTPVVDNPMAIRPTGESDVRAWFESVLVTLVRPFCRHDSWQMDIVDPTPRCVTCGKYLTREEYMAAVARAQARMSEAEATKKLGDGR